MEPRYSGVNGGDGVPDQRCRNRSLVRLVIYPTDWPCIVSDWLFAARSVVIMRKQCVVHIYQPFREGCAIHFLFGQPICFQRDRKLWKASMEGAQRQQTRWRMSHSDARQRVGIKVPLFEVQQHELCTGIVQPELFRQVDDNVILKLHFVWRHYA